MKNLPWSERSLKGGELDHLAPFFLPQPRDAVLSHAVGRSLAPHVALAPPALPLQTWPLGLGLHCCQGQAFWLLPESVRLYVPGQPLRHALYKQTAVSKPCSFTTQQPYNLSMPTHAYRNQRHVVKHKV